MIAENRALLSDTKKLSRIGKTCIFISHQKKDREACKMIADYILSIGIDVYFDEYDADLKIAVQKDNPKGVVAAIKKGIKFSTHMLCVISPNTLLSRWVPFEVGYGYDNTDLASLTLKNIKNSELPDYIKITPIIRDIKGLNDFIRGFSKKTILENGNIVQHNSWNHPLSSVMDKKQF